MEKYTYTLQEVKDFLGSKSNNTTSLKRSLTRKGFEVSVKKENFILDKELVKSDTVDVILGFKPARPNYTILVVKALLEHTEGFQGSYKELADYIEQNFGEKININHIGDTYRELVKAGFAMSSQDARQYGFKELRKSGSKLTEEDKQEFFEKVETIKQTLLTVGIPHEEANSKAFGLAADQLGRINSVPFKLLNFTPTHIEWFKQQ